jgi:hypothetical protein
VQPWTVLVAPLVFMVVGVVGTNRSGVALASWATVGLVATVIAFKWMPLAGARRDAATGRVHIPGSYYPAVFMLGSFFVTYFINVAFAVHPELAASRQTQIIAAAIMGTLTGAFFGRALKQFRAK